MEEEVSEKHGHGQVDFTTQGARMEAPKTLPTGLVRYAAVYVFKRSWRRRIQMMRDMAHGIAQCHAGCLKASTIFEAYFAISLLKLS